jgi:hydroxyacylglutathione hydrolase
MGLLLDTRTLWFAGTNCYVAAAGRGEPAVLIDAPPDASAVGDLLADHDLVPVALLVTHGHVDHCGGAGAVAAGTGATAYLHPDDDWLARDPVAQVRALFGMEPPGDYAPPERYTDLADGEILDLAGMRFEVLHTPGHTPGHCCFRLADAGILFSGDHLFAGSIGRTDLPGGDYDTLIRSMRDRVLPLPDETRVLPGHGPGTTLARERLLNPFLQEPPP